MAFAAGIAVSPSAAQQAGTISIELNKTEPSGEDCVLTFVVANEMDNDLSKLAYEFVVFDDQFRVERMTVFDFRDLSAGKQRVRQFQLPKTNCGKLGRLLINDVSSCEGIGVEASHCVGGLRTSNKTKIEFVN